MRCEKDNVIINVALRQTERVFDPHSKFGVDYQGNFLHDWGLMESIWMLSLLITIFNTGRRPRMTPSFYWDRYKTNKRSL